MSKSRASKGFLLTPVETENFSSDRRQKWLEDASKNFVQPSSTNKAYYRAILEALWPVGHGVPGPAVSQDDLRIAIDRFRGAGRSPYIDVFRRVRELQGDEGFTSIIKEGVKYQLTSLEVASKREPRAKPTKATWNKVRQDNGFRCTHCGAKEPDVKLSPDHRVPRSRGGTNDDENWQPLCEQCNNIKSSACQGCNLKCLVCSWAYPEVYKPIIVNDSNKIQIQRAANQQSIHQSDLVNQILAEHFNKNR